MTGFMCATAHKAKAQSPVLPDFGTVLKFGLLAGDSIHSADSINVYGWAGSSTYVSTGLWASTLYSNGGNAVSLALQELDSMRNYLTGLSGISLAPTIADTTLVPAVYQITGNAHLSDTLWLSSGNGNVYVINVIGNLFIDSSFVLMYDVTEPPMVIWNITDSLVMNSTCYGIMSASYINASNVGLYSVGLYSTGKTDLKGSGEVTLWKISQYNPNATCDLQSCGNLISNHHGDVTVPIGTSGVFEAFSNGFVPCWNACKGTADITSTGWMFAWSSAEVNPITNNITQRHESYGQSLLAPLQAGQTYILGYDFRNPLNTRCNPNFTDQINILFYSSSGVLPNCNTPNNIVDINPGLMTAFFADQQSFVAPQGTTSRVKFFTAPNGGSFDRLLIYPLDNFPYLQYCTINGSLVNNIALFNLTNLRLYEINAGADVLLECGNSAQLGCINTNIQQAFPTAQFQWQVSTDNQATWTNITGATNATYTVSNQNTSNSPLVWHYQLVVTVNGQSLGDVVEVTLDANPMMGGITLTGPTRICDITSNYTIDNFNPATTYTITCDNGTVQNQSGANFDVVWNDLNGGTIFIITNSQNPCPDVSEISLEPCCKWQTIDAQTWTGNLDNPADLAANLGITGGAPYTISNSTIVIHNTFNINDDINFNNCELVFGPNANLVQQNGTTATYVNSYLHACLEMWQGMTTIGSATLNFNNSLFEDAFLAIDIEEDDFLMTSDCIFNKNLNAIRVTNTTANNNVVSNNDISNTAFVCNDLLFNNSMPLPNFANVAIYNQIGSNSVNLRVPFNNQNFSQTGFEIINFQNWDFPQNWVLTNTLQSNNENYFANQNLMIDARNSGVTICRNRFENNDWLGTIGNYIGVNNILNGVAISARNNNTIVVRNITVGDVNDPLSGNIFVRCGAGVLCQQNYNVEINYNDFSLCILNAGVKNNNFPFVFNNINITQNHSFGSTSIGFYGFNNLWSRNYIFSNKLSNVTRSGIRWDNPLALNPGIMPVWTMIEMNGIDGNNMTSGIIGTSIDRLSALSNSIIFTAPLTSITGGPQRYGINVSTSSQVYIADNFIERTSAANFTGTNFTSLTGIAVNVCPRPIVCNNHTLRMGSGLSFSGGCAQSSIALNKMNQDFLGVQLVGANIATGSSLTVPGDNEWNGITGPYNIAGSIIGINHDWHWNQTNVNMDPNNHNVVAPIPLSFNDTPINPTTNPYNAGCGNYTVRSEGLDNTEEIDLDLLKSISSGYFNYGVGDSASTRYLFDQLYFLSVCDKYDSLIISLSSTDTDFELIQNYRISLSDSFAAKANAVIRFADKQNWQFANANLSQLAPVHTAELVLRNVLGIKIAVFERDSIYMTQEEIEAIEPIANADAGFYGPGVYMARALLAIVGENLNKNTNAPQINVPFLNIDKKVWHFPNPSNGILKFYSNFQSDENYILEIFNLQGYKLIHIPKFKLLLNEVDISFLSSGAYYFKLSNGIDSFRGTILLTTNN